MKECTKCHEVKPLGEYYYTQKQGTYESACRKCRKDSSLIARKKRMTALEIKTFERNRALKNKYGIDSKDYQVMHDAQEGCCAICSIHEEHTRLNRLVVDHCHYTLRIRALLCNNCNTAIGLLKDNPKAAHSAGAYLTKHGC